MSVLLYLLPLGLIFDLVGYVTPAGRLFLIFGLLALPLCLRPSRSSAWLGVVLALAAVLRASVPMPVVAETALFLLLHFVIWTVVAPVPRALRLGVVVYAMLHLGLFLSPLGYPVVEAMTEAGNRVSAWITGNSYHLGPTYQNLGGFLLFLVLSVFSWDGSRVALVRTGCFVLVAFLLNALAGAILIDKVNFAGDFAWTLKFRDPFGFAELGKHLQDMLVVFFPVFVFLGYLLAYLTLHYGMALKTGDGGDPQPGWAALKEELRIGRRHFTVTAVAVLWLVVAVPPTAWRHSAAPEIIFVDHGVVSFTKPDYTRYGEYAGGMFGLFPDYTRLLGCKASVVKEVPPTLDPGQILVLTNLEDDFGEATRRRIWDFVNRGGKLWVIGDHTFIKNGCNHLNEMLAPTHISFNNDSAQFFPQGWFNSYRMPQGTPFGALRDDAENLPGILVGASLEIDVPAQPLVFGRFAYSDWGLATPDPQRGYLGDFKYQPSERLGDLVLVAGEVHGRGRVLVFGDTTSFFNNNLPRSFEMLRACLSWLGEPNVWLLPASVPGRTAAVVLILALTALAFLWRTTPVGLGALLATGTLSLLAHGTGGRLPLDQEYARGHLAVIDFSHQPFASKHASMDSGLHGVSINLMRHGQFPVDADNWDPALLDLASHVVINAPRRPVTPAETRDLMRFMERGGTVILGCGHFEAEACRNLLDPLGCRIGSLPLGRFFDRPAFGQPVSFMSAWPIEIDRDKAKEAKVLCAYDDWPLMVSLPVDKGRLVLIGDSEFLHNRNVEGAKNHDPANTAFLKNLLDSTPQ